MDFFRYAEPSFVVGCVRTIVVWKLQPVNVLLTGFNPSCVRTIVVWKHRYELALLDPTLPGCVRTIVVWKHSIQGLHRECAFCCVRTIVVWKQFMNAARTNTFVVLRKNHSGMETWNVRIFGLIVSPVA